MRILITGTGEPLLSLLRQLRPQAQFIPFPDPEMLLRWLEISGADFDAAFLLLTGQDEECLAKIRAARPRGNLIIVSDSPQYMETAFRLHASGYLLTPVTLEAAEAELSDLRYPARDTRLQVQTFGNFEVFADGKPVHFRRSRSKELFAYLVDRRGAGITMGELISVLWEGKPDTDNLRSQLRSLIADLRSALRLPDEEAPIIKRRDLIAVDPERLDCDYYRFLAGEPAAVNAFHGEYMANYSWAETTVGTLQSLRRSAGRKGKR